jgi:hypothetical protein
MSNNSGTAKVKIVKNERDPPLFTSKQLIKFKKILRNTTQVIVRHLKTIVQLYERRGKYREPEDKDIILFRIGVTLVFE